MLVSWIHEAQYYIFTLTEVFEVREIAFIQKDIVSFNDFNLIYWYYAKQG